MAKDCWSHPVPAVTRPPTSEAKTPISKNFLNHSITPEEQQPENKQRGIQPIFRCVMGIGMLLRPSGGLWDIGRVIDSQLAPVTKNRIIHDLIIYQWLVVHGSWLKAPGSCLKARASRLVAQVSFFMPKENVSRLASNTPSRLHHCTCSTRDLGQSLPLDNKNRHQQS